MKKISRAVILILLLVLWPEMEVCAADSQDLDNTSIMDEIDFSGIQEVLDDLQGSKKLNFQELVSGLASGDTEFSLSMVTDLISDQLFYEIEYNRKSILHIMILAVISALFTNFSSIFQNQQTSEVSFYIIYLLLITILLASFQTIIGSVTETMETMVEFSKILAPAYFLAVAFAKGSTTAAAFYNVLLFVIYIVNWIILKFILPLVNVYVILVMVNHLSKEDFLSKFSDLVKTIIEWVLKTLMGLVVGVNVIQSLLAPVIDTVKTNMINKAAGAIPGVGGAVNAVTEVVLGSAVLIKNGIGVAALVILLVICAVPVLKLLIFTLMYKFASAVIQPVADRRMLGCVEGAGEGVGMLLKVLLTTTALFLISIAIVTASTS